MQSSFTFARWLLINKLQFDSDDVRLSTFDEHTWAQFLESEHSHSIISSIAPLLVDKPKTTRKPAIKKNKTTRVDVSTQHELNVEQPASGDAPLAEPVVAPKKKTVKQKNVTELPILEPVQETVVDAAPTDESILQLEQPVVAPKKKVAVQEATIQEDSILQEPVVAPKKKTVKKKVAVAATEESVPTEEPVVDAAAPTEESVLLQEPALTEQPVVAPKKKTVKKKAAVAAADESVPTEEPVVDAVVPTEEPVVAPKKKTIKKKAAVPATEESAPTEEPVVDAVVPTEESVVAPKKKTVKKKEPIAASEESVVAPKKKTNKKIVEETLAEPVDVVAPTDDSLHAEPYEQTLLTEEFINDTLHYRDDNTGTLYSIDTDGNLVPL